MKSNREQRRSNVKLIPGLPYDPGTRVPHVEGETAKMKPQREGHKKAGQAHWRRNPHLD